MILRKLTTLSSLINLSRAIVMGKQDRILINRGKRLFSTEQVADEQIEEKPQQADEEEELELIEGEQLESDGPMEVTAEMAKNIKEQQMRVQLIGKHLLLDKFYWDPFDQEYYDALDQKLKDYEQEIGVSLTNLQMFPIVSRERGSKFKKSYAYDTKQLSPKDKQSMRLNIMTNSMSRDHLLITASVIEDFINNFDLQLLDTLRRTGAFAAENTLRVHQVRAIIGTYFKTVQQQHGSYSATGKAELLLNYIPYCHKLLQGTPVEEPLAKDMSTKMFAKLSQLDPEKVNKLRLAWALIKLEHKNPNPKQISSEGYNSSHLKFILQQISRIQFSDSVQKKQNLSERLKSEGKREQRGVREQQLHRMVFLSYGEQCLMPILNWMMNYFPTLELFQQNLVLLISLLYLVQQQSFHESQVFYSKGFSKYYSILLNMIKNNIEHNTQRHELYEQFLFQTIPSNLYKGAHNPKLLTTYQNRVKAWKGSVQFSRKQKPQFNYSQHHLQEYSTSCQNSFLARILRNIEQRQMVYKGFTYMVPGSHSKPDVKYTTLRQYPDSGSNFEKLSQENSKSISQTDFVKNLIGSNYEKVYQYFNRHIRPRMAADDINTLSEEHYDKLYHFQNRNVKAFYILWQMSKQLREEAAPKTLLRQHLSIKQEKQKPVKEQRAAFFKDYRHGVNPTKFKNQKDADKPSQEDASWAGTKSDDFDDVPRTQRVTRPKYDQRNRHPEGGRDRRKYRERTYGQVEGGQMLAKGHQIDEQLQELAKPRLSHQEVQQLQNPEPTEKPKYRNKERGYQQHNLQDSSRKPGKAHFSTTAQNRPNNSNNEPENKDGYAEYRKSIKEMSVGTKIFNFEQCNTAEQLEKEFLSKHHLLNRENYKEVVANNKIPILRRGQKLFKFFFLNNKAIVENKEASKETLPQIPQNINNLRVSFESEIGLIDKDYREYLKSCSFMFPLAYETYLSLLEDQARSYHRRSFKTIVSHKIAFASTTDSSSVSIDSRFVELMCDICLQNRIGITLLQMAYLIYANNLRISESSLQKVCSTLYMFNALREDAFVFAQKFCGNSGLKFKVNYFKPFVSNLIETKNYIELQMIVNKLLRELREKPYRFDPKLSNEDNELLEKEWKGKEKNRYVGELYEMLEFISENVQQQVPEFLTELYDLYLTMKDNRNSLTPSEYNIAVIVNSLDPARFGDVIKSLQQNPAKVTASTMSALIKAFSMYPRQLNDYFQAALKMTLYDKKYDLKDSHLMKLTQIFISIDKPMIFGTFLQHLIKVESQFTQQVRSALYAVLSKTQDDQSKQYIFGLLSVLFNPGKVKQKLQLQQTMNQEQKKRKSLQQIALKSKLDKQMPKTQVILNKQMSPGPITSAPAKNKPKGSGKAQPIDLNPPQTRAKSLFVPTEKKLKGIPKGVLELSTFVDSRKKGDTFDSDISFATYEKASKTVKRNKTLKSFADAYLTKDKEEQVDPKKKKGKGEQKGKEVAKGKDAPKGKQPAKGKTAKGGKSNKK